MRRWTYQELTVVTENTIREYLSNAARKPDSAEMYLSWAFGAYTLWAEITKMEQEYGDFERLKKLVMPD